jgi:5-methylcytosine-specific restriction endonuclease McrA
MRLCSVPGCTNKFDSYNLCRSHRLQQIRGIELRPIKKLRPKGYYPCKFDGCDHIQNSVKLGLCSGHESQLKATEVDHRIPLSRGGSAWPANLVPACKPCNCSKNNMPYREWMEKIAA